MSISARAIPLQGKLLLVTQIQLISPTTVAGILYGIAFTLFCLYVLSLAPRLRDGGRKRQSRFMLGYSIIIMLSTLCFLVSNTWVTQDVYINHCDYPGGPASYTLSTQMMPAMIVTFSSQTIIDLLTSAVQIWRVRVIWSGSRYANFVIVLPVLCSLTLIALRLRTLVHIATISIAEAAQMDSKTGVVEFVTQAATTLLCTLSISLYLIFKQRQHNKLLGKTQGSIGYLNIVAMIIESYAVESLWLLILAILWVPNPAIEIFFLESVLYIEVIAYLLVQYRVASGTAFESRSGQSSISSLQWKSNHVCTTQLEGPGESRGGPCVSVMVPEALDTQRVSNMV